MTGQDVYGIFETIAPGYDRFNRIASLGLDGIWRARAASFVAPSKTVLDICCGSGELTIECAQFADEVVGIDFSPGMLGQARRKVEALKMLPAGTKDNHGRPPLRPGVEIRFLSADARSLPFPDERFDAVASAFALRNITPGLARSFKEIYRVLNPQGRAVLLDFARPRWWPLRMMHEIYLSAIMPSIGFFTTGAWKPFSCLRRSIQGFLDPALVCESLSECGFTTVRYEPVHCGLVVIYIAEKGITR